MGFTVLAVGLGDGLGVVDLGVVLVVAGVKVRLKNGLEDGLEDGLE